MSNLVPASDFELVVDCSVEQECCCHAGNGDPILLPYPLEELHG